MKEKLDSHAEDSLNKAVQKTVDYLYNIKGDVEPELYQAIATLRQLINEEFKPKESISSQFIYDILNPAISAYTTNKIIEEWNIIHETLHSATLVEQAHIDKVMNERIKALNHRKDKND